MATWTRNRLETGLALALGVGVLAVGSLVAFGPPAGADIFRSPIVQPASSRLKSCGTVKRHGVKWHVVARGVSCAFAKSWLPKMIAAREREPGLWNGPRGWLCSKKHRFPHGGPHGRPAGPLVSGQCAKAGGFQIGWHRV
jgi:hypothetical protein